MAMADKIVAFGLRSIYLLILSIIISAFFIQFVYAESSDTVRLEKLETAIQKSRSGILSLTESTFREYVEAKFRSYSFFILFTADSQLCKACPAMKNVLEHVALDYYKLPSKKKGKYPTFFGELELSAKNQNIMKDYNVRTAPLLYHFNAGKNKLYPTSLKSKDTYQAVTLHPNPMKSFINRKIGSAFKIVKGGYAIPFVPYVRNYMPWLIVSFLLIGSLIGLWKLWESSYFWFLIVMVVYMFSLGGGHFSWIHNTPWAVVSQQGVLTFVEQGSSRSQYVAEGLFFSVLCVFIAGLTLAIQELPSIVTNKTAQRLLGWFFFLLLYTMVATLHSLYEFKSPGYLTHTDL